MHHYQYLKILYKILLCYHYLIYVSCTSKRDAETQFIYYNDNEFEMMLHNRKFDYWIFVAPKIANKSNSISANFFFPKSKGCGGIFGLIIKISFLIFSLVDIWITKKMLFSNQIGLLESRPLYLVCMHQYLYMYIYTN